MAPRTLQRWQGQAGAKKVGRPAHSRQALEEARPRVLEVLKTLGFKTGKDTAEKLLQDVPRRVVRTLLKVLKAEHQAELDRERRKARKHVEVLVQGVLETQDSTHTGSFRRRKAWAEVSKDAATLEGRAFGDGQPLTAAAMLGHLQERKEAGTLPLVFGLDNGPGNRAQAVQDLAKQERVVLLYNRPHTPTDNARVERCIGEGKALAGLGKGVTLESREQGVQNLDQALKILNQRWPRKSKGGLTANQLKETLPHWTSFTTREAFYEATQQAIRESTAGLEGKALRRETREAIFRTLERFGLILRTRGDLNRRYAKPDIIS